MAGGGGEGTDTDAATSTIDSQLSPTQQWEISQNQDSSSSSPTVRISVDSNHSISVRINLQQTISDPSRSSSMDPVMDNLLGIEESMIFNPTTTSSTEINHLWKDDPSFLQRLLLPRIVGNAIF